MSRIGLSPITIPAGVEVKITEDNVATVKGTKGTLMQALSTEMSIKQDAGVITVSRPNDKKRNRELHGLTRTLLNNMIIGVTTGFSKELEVTGVGYRVAKQGKELHMTLGYSHPVIIPEPENMTIDVPAPNKIVVSGPDKQKVGQLAAEIREKRLPEPYKGKGIRYVGEYIIRKDGKAGKTK